MVYNTKKAAQGIGTLIIFIAMILVAAVAAGVLIQTASSLQSKSLDVGRQSQEKLTTSLEVVQVTAQNTNNSYINASGDSYSILVRLGSGSTPIRLDDLIVTVDTASGSEAYTHNVGAIGNSPATFNVTYVSNGGASTNDGYLVTGDLVRFNVPTPYDIGEGEQLTISLLSKNGAPQPIDLTTPSAMIREVTRLFP